MAALPKAAQPPPRAPARSAEEIAGAMLDALGPSYRPTPAPTPPPVLAWPPTPTPPVSERPATMTGDLERHLRGLDEISLAREKIVATIVGRISQAERLKLEVLVRRGELLAKGDVERARLSRIIVLRELLLSIPARAAPRIANKPAPAVEVVLKEEIRAALSELSRDEAHGLLYFDQQLHDDIDALVQKTAVRQRPPSKKEKGAPALSLPGDAALDSTKSLVDETKRIEKEILDEAEDD